MLARAWPDLAGLILLASSCCRARYWRQLIGTGGSWFLFDISYYGTAIFQPIIIQAIFTEEKDVITDAFFWHNLLVSALGIPGVLVRTLNLEPCSLNLGP